MNMQNRLKYPEKLILSYYKPVVGLKNFVPVAGCLI